MIEPKLTSNPVNFSMFTNASWAARKRWIAYGAGNALLGLRAIQHLPFAYVVDDTPGFSGQQIDGLTILPPSQLLSEDSTALFVVICANTSSAVAAISRRLVEMGFEPGQQFADCSYFQIPTMADRLQETFGLAPNVDRVDQVRGLSLALRPRNLSSIAGTWLFLELLDSCPGLRGAVAECGIYQGANALIASVLSATLRRRSYELFDSFQGLAALSAVDPASRRGEFADVSLAEIRVLFASFSNTRIIKGPFDETLPASATKDYSVVYIDCDLRDPTLYCCEHFWDLIAPGGFLLVHDYWVPSVPLPLGSPPAFEGVREAVDQFCAANHLQTVVFPETSHVVLRKDSRII